MIPERKDWEECIKEILTEFEDAKIIERVDEWHDGRILVVYLDRHHGDARMEICLDTLNVRPFRVPK